MGGNNAIGEDPSRSDFYVVKSSKITTIYPQHCKNSLKTPLKGFLNKTMLVNSKIFCKFANKTKYILRTKKELWNQWVMK